MPGDTDEGRQLYEITKKVIELNRAKNPHFRAVQAQCAFANEIYLGVLELCVKNNGIAAEALVRTLFETIVNAAVLAKHREKLPDFIRHGKFTQLRVLHFTDPPELIRAKRDKLKKATEAEFQALYKEFNNIRWHKLTTKDSFIEAGLTPAMYNKYYRRSSPIAHGEPYVTLRSIDADGKHWRVEARKEMWRNYVPPAYIQSAYLMLLLLSVVNEQFKLGIEKELDAISKLVDEQKTCQLDAKLKEIGEKL